MNESYLQEAAGLPADFKALQEEIKRRGWDRRPTARMLLECGLHCLLAVGGLALFLPMDSPWARFACLLISTYGFVGISTSCHTASHYAVFKRKKANERLTFFGYPVMLGLSATYWWHHHLGAHHKSPNGVGVDADIDLKPFFAVTEDVYEHAGPWLRAYYERQWLLAPLAIALNSFNIQRRGWVYLLSRLGNRQRRRPEHGLDLALLLLHFGLWLGLPMLFFSAGDVVLLYVIRFSMISYGLFVTFGPCHYPREAACVAGEAKSEDFILRQTATTINFRTGFLGKLLCAGLEYQIEHHLFGHVAHPHYPRLSPLVRDFCRRHGYPYHSFSWDRAIWKTLTAFRERKPVLPELARVPANSATDIT